MDNSFHQKNEITDSIVEKVSSLLFRKNSEKIVLGLAGYEPLI